VAALTDVDTREKLLLFCLASLVLILGVWPDPLLEMMSASVEQLVTHISQSKLP
jgi:NADH-quinone oxidoreductase subunit M